MVKKFNKVITSEREDYKKVFPEVDYLFIAIETTKQEEKEYKIWKYVKKDKLKQDY